MSEAKPQVLVIIDKLHQIERKHNLSLGFQLCFKRTVKLKQIPVSAPHGILLLLSDLVLEGQTADPQNWHSVAHKQQINRLTSTSLKWLAPIPYRGQSSPFLLLMKLRAKCKEQNGLLESP